MVRKEAIELIEEEKSLLCDIDIGEETKIAQAYDMAIKALKRKQQTKWIPVTERLPEEDIDVFITVCIPDGRGGVMKLLKIAAYGQVNPMVNKKCWVTDDFRRIDKAEVIAWQSLPEPYKEDE